MIDCGALQERMPGVAHQGDAWSPDEAAHLDGCGECALEWRLVRQAAALGDYRPAALPGMEAALLERLRTDLPSRRRTLRQLRWQVPLWTAVAASLALVVWGPLRHRNAPVEALPAVTSEAEVQLFPELLPLSEPQLQGILESWQAEEAEALGAVMPSLDNLDEQQLRAVLRQVEEGT